MMFFMILMIRNLWELWIMLRIANFWAWRICMIRKIKSLQDLYDINDEIMAAVDRANGLEVYYRGQRNSEWDIRPAISRIQKNKLIENNFVLHLMELMFAEVIIVFIFAPLNNGRLDIVDNLLLFKWIKWRGSSAG